MNTVFHVHPAVVHFPIALFVTALVFEAISLGGKKESYHQAAKYVFVFASLMTPIAVQTGLWELQKYKLHHPVAQFHQNFAYLTLGLSLVAASLLFFEKRFPVKFSRFGFFILLGVIVVCVSAAAYNGGRLVYEYGIGVE